MTARPKKTPDPELDPLEQLAAAADRVVAEAMLYLTYHPSPKVAHYTSTITTAAAGFRAAMIDIRAARARAASRDAVTTYDRFTLEMAEKLKITPDEFLALQEHNRTEMREARTNPQPTVIK